jgi:hypothetical protein
MWWFMLQPHHETQIHLHPKHNIFAMGGVINFTHLQENRQAGRGIQEVLSNPGHG